MTSFIVDVTPTHGIVICVHYNTGAIRHPRGVPWPRAVRRKYRGGNWYADLPKDAPDGAEPWPNAHAYTTVTRGTP